MHNATSEIRRMDDRYTMTADRHTNGNRMLRVDDGDSGHMVEIHVWTSEGWGTAPAGRWVFDLEAVMPEDEGTWRFAHANRVQNALYKSRRTNNGTLAEIDDDEITRRMHEALDTAVNALKRLRR
jgi:hypothetical protein